MAENLKDRKVKNVHNWPIYISHCVMADYTRPRFTHTVSKWKYQFQITVLGCTVLCIESCNIDFLGGNAGGDLCQLTYTDEKHEMSKVRWVYNSSI